MERAQGVKQGSREEIRVVSPPMATPPTPLKQDYEGWLEVVGVSKLREPGISSSFTIPEPNCHFPPHSIHNQWAQESPPSDQGGRVKSCAAALP